MEVIMNITDAKNIVVKYNENTSHSEKEDFMVVEALEYLINENHDPGDMMYLGGLYYEWRNFDLALKYYEMAAEYDYDVAYECLGYIWYYGRTGEKDYKKAFEYYNKAAERGNIVSKYKVADMYKNGYYVEKDYEKYKAIIEKAYEDVKDARNLFDPLPEIFTRLANIRAEEGDKEEALRLFEIARDFLSQRIQYNPFFGNLTIMKWLVIDMYKLTDVDMDDLKLYDLYEVLRRPCEVEVGIGSQKVKVKSELDEGAIAIEMNGKWFRNIDDFYRDAVVDGKRITDYGEMSIIY